MKQQDLDKMEPESEDDFGLVRELIDELHGVFVEGYNTPQTGLISDKANDLFKALVYNLFTIMCTDDLEYEKTRYQLKRIVSHLLKDVVTEQLIFRLHDILLSSNIRNKETNNKLTEIINGISGYVQRGK